MQQSTHIQTTEAAIIHHFRDAGDDLSAETKVLDAAIRTLPKSRMKLALFISMCCARHWKLCWAVRPKVKGRSINGVKLSKGY